MKKSIYKVFVEQTYNCHTKTFFKKNTKHKKGTVVFIERYILAKDRQDAIDIFNDRYEIDNDKFVGHIGFFGNDDILDDFSNEIKVIGVAPTFQRLKEKLRADEFLEYCKQELYPIEMIVK